MIRIIGFLGHLGISEINIECGATHTYTSIHHTHHTQHTHTHTHRPHHTHTTPHIHTHTPVMNSNRVPGLLLNDLSVYEKGFPLVFWSMGLYSYKGGMRGYVCMEEKQESEWRDEGAERHERTYKVRKISHVCTLTERTRCARLTRKYWFIFLSSLSFLSPFNSTLLFSRCGPFVIFSDNSSSFTDAHTGIQTPEGDWSGHKKNKNDLKHLYKINHLNSSIGDSLEMFVEQSTSHVKNNKGPQITTPMMLYSFHFSLLVITANYHLSCNFAQEVLCDFWCCVTFLKK